MKIKPFMSTTGVVLILNDDNGMEFGQLRLPKDCLSDVAVACIRELNMDAPQELTELCREVSAAVYGGDDPLLPAFPDLVRADEIRAWFMERGFYGRELGTMMNLSYGATVSIKAIIERLNMPDILEHVLRIPNTGKLTAVKMFQRCIEHGWITDREVYRRVHKWVCDVRDNTE